MSKKTSSVKPKKSPFNVRAGQFLYLSFACFNQNGLWESASSCSYGFICSFIPIVFMIMTIILGVVRVTPGILNYIQSFLFEIAPMFDLEPFVNTLLSRHMLSFVDIILGLWIIWMARKLCLSIIRGLTNIFGEETKRKNWWNQVLTFISEFVLVFLVAVLILSTFILRRFINSPAFDSIITKFPHLFSSGSNVIATLIMYLIMFICSYFAYRYLSGVFPSSKKCFICAFLNTVCFYGLVKFFDAFINRANYNFLYGTISSIIILIVKVYFFFVLFLLFAQMIYVSKYFDKLLKSQIYLLPKEQDANLAKAFIRMLFINPSILQNEDNTMYFNAQDIIFSKGDPVDCVYYLHKGIIAETKDDETINYIEPGTLLGESLCIINGNHDTSAKALTNCEIVSFSSEEFMEMLVRDPRIATQAVSKLHSFTKKIN